MLIAAGGAYVEFLESLSIASVWRSVDSWAGSSSAVVAGLTAEGAQARAMRSAEGLNPQWESDI